MHAPAQRTRLSSEIRIELISSQENVLPRIARVVTEVRKQVQEDGDPTEWLNNLQIYLATGEPMIVHARMGRTLVGFLVLDADKGAAPFSWVDQRYRTAASANVSIPLPASTWPARSPSSSFPRK